MAGKSSGSMASTKKNAKGQNSKEDHRAAQLDERQSPDPDLEYGLFYLWHLAAIGLIEWKRNGKGEKVTESKCWLVPGKHKGDEKITVAIIDNGCAEDHPNLSTDRINHVEFFAYPQAAFYLTDGKPHAEELMPIDELSFARELKDEVNTALELPRETSLSLTLAEYLGEKDPYKEIQNPSHRFASHGTACAGLVGGCATKEGDPSAPPDNPWAIDYSGVDPFAHILAINTVYNHEYWPMIAALVYAARSCADVILIPRAVDDMAPPAFTDVTDFPSASDDPRHTRFQEDTRRFRDKQLFETILRVICKHVPTVVAAGNTGIGEMAYPARLSTLASSNEDFPLITVGAVTARGLRASYSAGSNGMVGTKSPFIYAPSNDHETMTQDFQRYDDLSWRARNTLSEAALKSYQDEPPFLGRLEAPLCDAPEGSPPENDFSPYGILAIDIPGPWGYDNTVGEARDLEDPLAEYKLDDPQNVKCQSRYQENQPRSLYALFGGTSAASAIVAGTISQMIRSSGKGSLSRDAITDKLRDTWGNPLNMEERDANGRYGKEVEGGLTNVLRAACAIKPTSS